jgi:hypothetical protein
MDDLVGERKVPPTGSDRTGSGSSKGPLKLVFNATSSQASYDFGPTRRIQDSVTEIHRQPRPYEGAGGDNNTGVLDRASHFALS